MSELNKLNVFLEVRLYIFRMVNLQKLGHLMVNISVILFGLRKNQAGQDFQSSPTPKVYNYYLKNTENPGYQQLACQSLTKLEW